MTLIKRHEFAGKLGTITQENGPKLFLLFGERYLCKQTADTLQESLLGWKTGNVINIDGDQEESSQTLAKLMSFSLLPGLQLFRVNDTRLFHSKNVSKNVWQKAVNAFQGNRTAQIITYLSDLYNLGGIDKEARIPLSQMSEEEWQSCFSLSKPADINWTDQFFEAVQEKGNGSQANLDITETYIASFKKGLPPNNFLILTAETVDKRKKLFTFFKENGFVIDCSVAEGASSAAQKVQKSVLIEMVEKTLSQFNKKIEPRGLEILFERLGFHPVAVVMETEKLALYCRDKDVITKEDINLMVGRTREDALFELTDHFGKKNLKKSLITLYHLQENGIHALAIIATLRNYIRKLMIFKGFQEDHDIPYQRGMSAQQFQNSCLPALKKKKIFSDLLKGHPYGLFMSFAKAAEFQITTLKKYLELILDAEFRLKGSGLPEHIILEQLLVCLLRGTPQKNPK